MEQLKTWLELMDFFGVVLLGFGAALAFVVVYTTFTANVTERTREIATMRTIGEDNLRLTVMITLENLAIAVAAIPLGIWLGIQAANGAVRLLRYRGIRAEGLHLPIKHRPDLPADARRDAALRDPTGASYLPPRPRRGDQSDGVGHLASRPSARTEPVSAERVAHRRQHLAGIARVAV